MLPLDPRDAKQHRSLLVFLLSLRKFIKFLNKNAYIQALSRVHQLRGDPS